MFIYTHLLLTAFSGISKGMNLKSGSIYLFHLTQRRGVGKMSVFMASFYLGIQARFEKSDKTSLNV